MSISTLKRAAAEVYHFATDERHRAFKRQRKLVGLHRREAEAADLAARLPVGTDLVAAAGPAADAASATLANKGWVDLPGLVSLQCVADIRAYFAPIPARDPYRPDLGRFLAPEAVPPQTHVSHYDNADILRAPHLLQLANDPRVLGIVSRFIGARPTLAAMRVWWSTPSADGTPEHAELFHRDVDDLRFVKLFVYLTDVGPDTGPHVFVEGSQANDTLTDVRRFSDEEVERSFGADAIRQLTGPAGTAFLENTFGMHRGVPPAKGPRLIFQPLYAMQPLIYGPRKPLISMRDLPAPVDPYINRVFVRA